jgi:hypothetical protein
MNHSRLLLQVVGKMKVKHWPQSLLRLWEPPKTNPILYHQSRTVIEHQTKGPKGNELHPYPLLQRVQELNRTTENLGVRAVIFFRRTDLGGVMGGKQDIFVRDVAAYMIIN